MQGGGFSGGHCPPSLRWLQGEGHTVLPTLVISSPCPISAAPAATYTFSPGPSALEAIVSTCAWDRSVAGRCPETLKSHPRLRRQGPSPEVGFICLRCLGPAVSSAPDNSGASLRLLEAGLPWMPSRQRALHLHFI